MYIYSSSYAFATTNKFHGVVPFISVHISAYLGSVLLLKLYAAFVKQSKKKNDCLIGWLTIDFKQENEMK